MLEPPAAQQQEQQQQDASELVRAGGADGRRCVSVCQNASSDLCLNSSHQVWEAAGEVQPLFADIDRMVHTNLKRVQQAMRRHRIGPHHFAGSTGAAGRRSGAGDRQAAATLRGTAGATPNLGAHAMPCHLTRPRLSPAAGYGHGDLGRAALDDVVAEVMGAEAAAVRVQFVSGTHAISAALFGCLRRAGCGWLAGCRCREGTLRARPAWGRRRRWQLTRPCLPGTLAGPTTSYWRWRALRMTRWRK